MVSLCFSAVGAPFLLGENFPKTYGVDSYHLYSVHSLLLFFVSSGVFMAAFVVYRLRHRASSPLEASLFQASLLLPLSSSSRYYRQPSRLRASVAGTDSSADSVGPLLFFSS
jgi:hypothetical protein